MLGESMVLSGKVLIVSVKCESQFRVRSSSPLSLLKEPQSKLGQLPSEGSHPFRPGWFLARVSRGQKQ